MLEEKQAVDLSEMNKAVALTVHAGAGSGLESKVCLMLFQIP